MRLSQLYKLNPKQRKKEHERALVRIRKAMEKLDKLGVWTIPTKKQIKESGEPITIWTRK